MDPNPNASARIKPLDEETIKRGDIEEIERILQEAEKQKLNISEIVNAPVSQWNQTPLHVAVSEGLFDMVCLLLQNGADINVVDKNCWSALHYAANHHQLEILEVLLKQRPKITLLNESGKFKDSCTQAQLLQITQPDFTLQAQAHFITWSESM
jgi:ankyrin repeat protein